MPYKTERLGRSSGHWRPGEVAAFVGIMSLGIVLRLWHLKTQCLTHDEIYEVDSVALPLAEFFWSPDGFPPLHRLLLWGGSRWMDVEVIGRWIGLVCGVVVLIGVFGVGREIAGRRAGLAAAAWTAISPLQIHYSQEARAYGLYLAMAALALWAYVIAWRDDTGRSWFWVVVTCALGEFSHYYFSLLILLFGVCWIADRLRSSRWRRGVAAFSALVLFQGGMYPLLREDLLGTIGYPEQTSFGVMEFGYTVYSFVAGYCLGPSQAALHSLASRAAIVGFLPSMLAAGVVLALPASIGARHLWRSGWLIVLVALGLGPVLLAGVLAWTLNLNYNVRYVVFGALPILVLLGVGWSHISYRSLRWASFVGMLALCLWGLYQRNYVAEYQNEDVRSAARMIQREHSHDDTVVLVNVGYMTRPVRYYLGADWEVVRAPQPDNPNGVIRSDEDVQRVLQMMAESSKPRAVVVLSRSFHGDPEGQLARRLAKRDVLARKEEFAGVTVFSD